MKLLNSIAFILVLIEFYLHFNMRNYKKSTKENARILMLCINIFVLLVLLQLFMKTHRLFILLPILLIIYNHIYGYNSYGTILANKKENWVLMGGLVLGILGFNL